MYTSYSHHKLFLVLSLTIFNIAFLFAKEISITESGGWLETAYIKWLPVAGADSYHVYYSGNGISDKKIDAQLIRSYGSYFRADIPGLQPGNYSLKLTAVTGEIESTSAQVESVQVFPFDRTGFAFVDNRIPGAYKSDGTPKSDAVIIYITENTKNTVSMDVIGANSNPCVGLQAILEGFKKGKDNRPLIVRMIGQITDLDQMDKGDIVIENKNNASGFITIEGVGNDAVADGWGIRLKNATNIEIRNIGFMNCDSSEGDNIGLQQNNSHVWVHHCDLFYGYPGSDSDQAKGDGALDSKRSGYVTFAYNHFWDTGKSNLLGNGAEDPEFLTYHHNWYDHSDSRHPRVRSHSVHVYNNYYDGISKYGVGATMHSSVFVEANYFRNCKYPMLISMQGSDVFDESKGTNDYNNKPTFSKEDGGIIKAFNNYIIGEKRFVPYGATGYPNANVDFDAYVVSDRNATVPSTVHTYKGSNIYNNFDTDASVMYEYTADSPEDARDKVIQYAGRMQGGDFQWTFNNAVDDTSYDVNQGLKQALLNYQTALVAVQGENEAVEEGGDGGDEGEVNDSGIYEHNFTVSGETSNFFTINGNLSDSKGTVQYKDLTLTHCLKIESSSSISFTTTELSYLTLVFNDGFNGKIKIDGNSNHAASGILSVPLFVGNHVITKDETCNLYYMRVEYDTISSVNSIHNEEISMYINPESGQLMLSADVQIKDVSVYNLTGKTIVQASGEVHQIDLSHLEKGIYLIRLQTTQGIISRKILEQ